METININNKLDQISSYWNPHIIGELNGQQVKIAKIKGDFIWHSHENEDELFWVIKGKLFIEFRDGTKEINEGEILIIPKGVEHRPFAPEEVHIALFEPAGTLNTGNIAENELTRKELREI